MTSTVIILGSLATMRLAWLAVNDDITAPIRRRVEIAAAEARKEQTRWKVVLPFFADLLGCCWCISLWFGFAVAASGYFWGDRWFWLIPAAALSFSAVAGILANLGEALAGIADD